MLFTRSLFAAAAAFSLMGQAAFAEIKTYAGPVKIGVVSGSTLTNCQAKSYNDFRRQKEHFGAFYRSETNRCAFWVRNFNDLKSAKAAAHKGCMILSENKGPCVLHAIMVPKDVPLDATQASGLGTRASRSFTGEYATKQKDGRHGAFAISKTSYGVSWNWENPAEARATAIAYCKEDVATLMTTLNIEGRAWAKKNGYTTCRVIDVVSP